MTICHTLALSIKVRIRMNNFTAIYQEGKLRNIRSILNYMIWKLILLTWSVYLEIKRGVRFLFIFPLKQSDFFFQVTFVFPQIATLLSKSSPPLLFFTVCFFL